MSSNEIVSINAEDIYQHPDNPRKDLGDLSELSESIKKKGVMQNLTVIPGHWDEKKEWREDGYTLIIGHRRCAAAKLAGITELPCRIVDDMSQKDQVSTMLEENMQRNDLTIWEQAQGFQMMLDLGDTEEQIAKKTGFSKTTINHRLNIAKLNQSELKKKEQDANFQLALIDLYALEKVKSVRKRNKILKESTNSRDLAIRARNAVAEERREKNAKVIGAMLEKRGVEKAPEKAANEMYYGKWKTIKEFELEIDAPKQIKLPKRKEQMYYLIKWNKIYVIIKAPKEKRELSEGEIAEKEKFKKKKQIKEILKKSSSKRKKFIEDIIAGQIAAVKDEAAEIDLIWKALAPLGACIYESALRRFFTDKDYYSLTEEERQQAKNKVDSLSTLNQMLIILHASMEGTETFKYNIEFNSDRGKAMLKGYEALEPYGWYFEDEDEKKVLEGTHELYVKAKEEKPNI